MDVLIEEELINKRDAKINEWQEDLSKSESENIIFEKYINEINQETFNDFKEYSGSSKIKCELTLIANLELRQVTLSDSDCKEFKNIYFDNVEFKNCIFDNIRFTKCWFINCTFEECSTGAGKIIFDKCNMRMNRHLNHMSNKKPIPLCNEFKNCRNIRIDIIECLADDLIFDNCQLWFSSIKNSEIENTIFNKCSFYIMNFTDNELDGIKIKDAESMEFTFRNTKSELNENANIYVNDQSFHNSINMIEKNYKKTDKEYLLKSYGLIVKAFRSIIGIMSEFQLETELVDEYIYMCKICDMHTKQLFINKFIAYVNYYLFGFGERLRRLIGWIVAYILSFSFIYMYTGIKTDSGVIKYVIFGGNPVSVDEVINDFLQCVHFSIITASTVGYGNVTPYSGWSMLFSVIQIILGIIFTAFFTSMIIKKFIR